MYISVNKDLIELCNNNNNSNTVECSKDSQSNDSTSLHDPRNLNRVHPCKSLINENVLQISHGEFGKLVESGDGNKILMMSCQ
jgi:hypothetical protein